MKTIRFSLCLLVLLGSAAFSQAANYELPPGAQVIEVQPIQSSQAPASGPHVVDAQVPSKFPGTIRMTSIPARNTPGAATISGPTRVSLVDPQAKTIINTIKILNFEGQDTFDIPYRIESGHYYHVAGVPKGKEGKPTIMWLKDYNGDGQAGEFALFDAIACMGLPTTLIGYSEAQDRVIQYPVSPIDRYAAGRNQNIHRGTSRIMGGLSSVSASAPESPPPRGLGEYVHSAALPPRQQPGTLAYL